MDLGRPGRDQLRGRPEDRDDPDPTGADGLRQAHVVGRIADIRRVLGSLEDTELLEGTQERRRVGLGGNVVVTADPREAVRGAVG